MVVRRRFRIGVGIAGVRFGAGRASAPGLWRMAVGAAVPGPPGGLPHPCLRLAALVFRAQGRGCHKWRRFLKSGGRFDDRPSRKYGGDDRGRPPDTPFWARPATPICRRIFHPARHSAPNRSFGRWFRNGAGSFPAVSLTPQTAGGYYALARFLSPGGDARAASARRYPPALRVLGTKSVITAR